MRPDDAAPRFLPTAAIAALLACALVWTGALERPRKAEELRWVRAICALKEKDAAGAGPGRVLVVSGSGALFSFDSPLAETALGRPVVNMATHAGLGLRYLLARADRTVRRGDLVLLVLEYDEWTDAPRTTDLAARFARRYDPAYVDAQPPLQRWKLRTSGDAMAALFDGTDALLSRLARGSERPFGYTAHLSPNGDYLDNEAAKSDPAWTEGRAEAADAPADKTAVALIAKTVAAWRRRGAEVFLLWPAFSPQSPSAGAAGGPLEGIRRAALQAHLPALGRPAAGFLPVQDMFDTAYHANALGRVVWTRAMLPTLCRAVACPGLAEAEGMKTPAP